MRKHLCWYVRGMDNATGFRAEINQARTISEMSRRLEDFFAHAA
jgi:tRNA-dihydrouridine synthase